MQAMGQTSTWTFQSPLTLELDITRGIWQSISEGILRVYNLAENTRSDLYCDYNNLAEFRPVIIRAGYKSWSTIQSFVGPVQTVNPYPIVFMGNIKQAYSQREGPNWVTTISAWDGGYGVTNGDINTPIQADAKLSQIVSQLVAAMPNVTLGYLDPSLKYSPARNSSLVGRPWDILQDIAKSLYADVWIDLQKVYMMSKAASVPGLTGGLSLITSETGLIETPLKQKSIVSFEMLFEPRLKVGQSIVLQSIETVNNGTYTVGGIDHRGVISDAVGGDLRTKVSCYYQPAYQPYGV